VSESLSPAARLLLLTAAVPPNDAALRGVLSAGVDWSELRDLAEYHNAAAIVLRQVGRDETAPTDPGYQDLRRLATLSAMRLLQLEHLLHETLDRLSAQGIEVMLLKGAALAYTAYSSFADRPMNDLDLLVRPEQADPVWTLLQTQGWTWPSARWAAGQYTTLHHLPPLLKEPGGFRLEIHREILPEGHPFRFTADALWERAQRVPSNGRVVTVPHPLHQLWHLCVHFAWSHMMHWGAWRTLRDGAAIIRRPVPWGEFVDLAGESRAATCAYWTLRLTRRLTGAAVPDQVLEALHPPRPESRLAKLERHYVSSFFPSAPGCPSIWLAQRLWEAGILPQQSGHGSARPWQVSKRWLAGSEEAAPPQPRFRTLWARLRKVPEWWTYFRRIRRLALPVNVP
jgi:putative nucleotidyltransferase-like protein